jgi:hypothetical protein
MKAGLLRKVAKSYAPFFSEEWKLIGSEFMRLKGDWVQFVTFNAMRGADRYVPRTGCEFLKAPGAVTATWLGQELLSERSGTQYWVAASRDPNDMFPRMCKQFFPPLQTSIDEKEIKVRLARGLKYHSYAYALCIIAAEEGNAWKAKRYYCAYKAAVSDAPWPWAEKYRAELATFLELMKTPEKLKAQLDSIRTEKLKALKLN